MQRSDRYGETARPATEMARPSGDAACGAARFVSAAVAPRSLIVQLWVRLDMVGDLESQRAALLDGRPGDL